MRDFATGATRDDAANKPHYWGYMSPWAWKEFAGYMLQHETQADGKKREPGNWKLGIPMPAYEDSLLRHTMDWKMTLEQIRDTKVDWDPEGTGALEDNAIELACAMMFNLQGWLHEAVRAREARRYLPEPEAVVQTNTATLPAVKSAMTGEEVPLYDPEWRDWNGGDCPVLPDTIVDVRLHGTEEHRGEVLTSIRADWLRWNYPVAIRSGDIVAYRVVGTDKVEMTPRL